MERVKDLDLYELLGIAVDASETAIKKAYRKRALKVHPDKNPNNPKAEQLFHQLSDALKVLTDSDARKAYDNVLKARKAALVRNRELDAKRRKLKVDLEKREQEAANREFEYKKRSEEEKLLIEIERLRKQGSKQLEEEQELMKTELNSHTSTAQESDSVSEGCNKLKLKWKEDPRYDQGSLIKIFSKYGDVSNAIISTKSGGKCSGLIEMSTSFAASMASRIETGFADNPLKVKLLEQKPQFTPSSSSSSVSSSTINQDNTDYETLVMRKLRQEEERKRLIKEIMDADAKENP